MDSSGNSITVCKLCQHYNPEGRRGGFCGRLAVPVSATWEACSLAEHPFEPSWQPTDDFNSILHNTLQDTMGISHRIEMYEISMQSLILSEY
ncbi:MAG: hypothetical protein ACKPCM_11260 [Pseudanabaena sp.]